MGPLIRSAQVALGFPRRRSSACCSRPWRLVGARLGEGEDAAVRQQERVPDHPQHAGRQRARAHRAGRARNRRRRPRRAGGDGLPDLRRRGGAVQLQRARAALLHAARRERGRHPGQSRPQGRAQARRATTSPSASARASRRSPRRYGARVAVAEVPPGPPVLQTLVAEIYGPDEERAARAGARRCATSSSSTAGVVDVDWYVEADQPKARFVIDKEKAALHGISAETISQTLRIAVGGDSVDLLHLPREKGGREHRAAAAARQPRRRRRNCSRCACAPAMPMRCPSRASAASRRRWCRCGELVTVERTTVDKSIYHKNLMPVTYVIGDVAGVVESPVYAIMRMNEALRKLDTRRVRRRPARRSRSTTPRMPFTDQRPGHQMGRRMAHHHRGVPRSRHGVRRVPGADLSS